jgi:hypothetical protein
MVAPYPYFATLWRPRKENKGNRVWISSSPSIIIDLVLLCEDDLVLVVILCIDHYY